MTAQLPSRERLEGIARGEKCYTHDDVVQVVRALLAAHEQEPVAYKATHLDSFAFGETKSAVEEHAERFGWELEFTEITPLYTHPAPSIPAAVPKGWKLVPTTATPSMVRAGGKAAREYLLENGGNSPYVIYEAMVAAAPKGV